LCEEGLKRLQQMLAEYQASNNVPQEVCDQILEAAKESSVGEDGVRSQVKIRKLKVENISEVLVKVPVTELIKLTVPRPFLGGIKCWMGADERFLPSSR